MFAITRETLPQVRQAGVCAVLVDKTRKTDAPMALAAMAFDFEQVDFADKLGEPDGSAVADVVTAPFKSPQERARII